MFPKPCQLDYDLFFAILFSGWRGFIESTKTTSIEDVISNFVWIKHATHLVIDRFITLGIDTIYHI